MHWLELIGWLWLISALAFWRMFYTSGQRVKQDAKAQYRQLMYECNRDDIH